MVQKQKASVAPMEGTNNECPECHEHTAYFSARNQANVCKRGQCDFWEFITEDQKPRKFTEAEVKAMIAKAMKEHVKQSHGGSNIPIKIRSPYDASRRR